MTAERNTRVKRLMYRSWYRGSKETDRILGFFARQHLESLSDTQLDEFEEILEENDVDIVQWMTGKQDVPEKYSNNSVMQRLLTFTVSAG